MVLLVRSAAPNSSIAVLCSRWRAIQRKRKFIAHVATTAIGWRNAMTCEICGHEHGPDVVHVIRTVDGTTADYVDAVASRAVQEEIAKDLAHYKMAKEAN